MRYSLKRHGRRWRIVFYDAATKRTRCVNLGDSSQISEERAHQLAREALEPEIKKVNPSAAPIKNFYSHIDTLSASHQKNVLRFHARLVEYFGPDVRLEKLSTQDVLNWVEWLKHAKRNDSRQGSLSDKTVKEHIDWLASVYNHSELPNPCKKVPRPRRSHHEKVERLAYFTPEEIKLILEEAPRHPAFCHAVTFMIHTGCRAAEMQSIRPDKVDIARKVVWVTGKGSKVRPLTLSGPMEPAWRALVLSAYEFPQYASFPRKAVDRICSSIGLKGHPHKLRHSFATAALLHFNPPWEIARLSKWLGHENIHTTLSIYGHLIAQEPPSGW